jgi:acetyl-CoA carboxylase beta subunit
MPTRNIRKSKAKAKTKAASSDREQLFERTRKRLQEKRSQRRYKTQFAHFWDLCPKCGGDMFEQKTLQIYFEVCRDCHGMYLDLAEIDLARTHLDPKKLLNALSKKAKTPKIPE